MIRVYKTSFKKLVLYVFRESPAEYPRKCPGNLYCIKSNNGKATMRLVKKIKILCEDTFFRGAFCGGVAGILKDIIDFILYLFKVQGLFFWSFTSVVAFDKLPKGLFMNITGICLEIIFSAFLGVLFVLIAQKIKTRHYLLMGTFFGSMVWFFIRAVIVCYKINQLIILATPLRPVITWLLSMVFGIVLAWLERRLSPKTS